MYVFCDNYFVPFALYFRKIIKKSKEYQRFWDPGSVFSGHVETKILKFSPVSAPWLHLGRGGRGGEGRGEEGKGREGEEGRGEGMGCSYLGPPTSKCVATALRNIEELDSNTNKLQFTKINGCEDHKFSYKPMCVKLVAVQSNTSNNYILIVIFSDIFFFYINLPFYR